MITALSIGLFLLSCIISIQSRGIRQLQDKIKVIEEKLERKLIL